MGCCKSRAESLPRTLKNIPPEEKSIRFLEKNLLRAKIEEMVGTVPQWTHGFLDKQRLKLCPVQVQLLKTFTNDSQLLKLAYLLVTEDTPTNKAADLMSLVNIEETQLLVNKILEVSTVLIPSALFATANLNYKHFYEYLQKLKRAAESAKPIFIDELAKCTPEDFSISFNNSSNLQHLLSSSDLRLFLYEAFPVHGENQPETTENPEESDANAMWKSDIIVTPEEEKMIKDKFARVLPPRGSSSQQTRNRNNKQNTPLKMRVSVKNREKRYSNCGLNKSKLDTFRSPEDARNDTSKPPVRRKGTNSEIVHRVNVRGEIEEIRIQPYDDVKKVAHFFAVKHKLDIKQRDQIIKNLEKIVGEASQSKNN